MNLHFLKKIITLGIITIFVLAYGSCLLAYSMPDLLELGVTSEGFALTDEVEDVLNENNPFSRWITESYGVANKLLGKNETLGFTRYQDNSGIMYYGSAYNFVQDEIKSWAKRIRRVKESAESQGKEMLFVLAPYKIVHGINEPSPHLPIYNPNAGQDELLKQLYQNQVPFVDLRNCLRESEEPFQRLFFKTEAMMSPYAGFLSATELVKQMKERFGVDLDPTGFYTDISNYNVANYENSLVGNMARPLGIGYAGTDDLTVLWPKFSTHLSWYDLEEGTQQVGSYEETLLDTSKIKDADPYKENAMNAYMSHCLNYEKIINLEKPEAYKLLVLRDDNFSLIAPIFSTMCSEMTLVNLNSKENDMNFDALIQEKVKEHDVILVVLSGMNMTESYFNYFKQ